MQKNTGSYLVDPKAWGYTLHDLAALGMYHLGIQNQAYAHAKIAYEMEPSNERLKNNMILLQKGVKDE